LLKSIFSPEFGFATIRVMTPLLFSSIGFAIAELSGTTNIALEGIMLVAAFVGVMVSVFTRSLLLAFVAGIASGLGMAALLGYFHLKLKADIILAAIALNLFATGITVFLLFLISHDKGTSISLKSLVFPSFQIPLLKSIPVIGPILSGHNLLTYLSFLSVIAFYLIIYKMPVGLQIRAVGQNPEAAQSVGVNVNRIKMYSLLLSGLFGALGGLYLSMGYVSWFSRGITAGRGFIAIAASYLGGNQPLGTFFASILFGIVNALAVYLSSAKIPSEIIQTIPYLATVIALTIYAAQQEAKKRK